MTFMKAYPGSLLVTFLVFWLVNDFEPVYQSVALSKSLDLAAGKPKGGMFQWRPPPGESERVQRWLGGR